MPQSGIIQRQYPRVWVLRGYDPNEPKTFTQSFPVASGVVILSGQVISLNWDSGLDQYEWVLGWTAGMIPYIALQDSADEDVIEAGYLTGLSSLGKFEIQTAFFNNAGTFNVDTPVSPDGVTGNIKVGTLASGTPIMGYVTRNRGPLDVSSTNSSAVNTQVVSFQTQFSVNDVNA